MSVVPPVPEHSPAPTPARAVYGFCLSVVSCCCGAVYLAWALLPPSWLAAVGLSYWPQQLWALTLPAAALLGLLLAELLFYPWLCLWQLPGLHDERVFRDRYSLPPAETAAAPAAIPAVCDLPLTDVCQRLYLRPQRDDRLSNMAQ